MNVQKLLLYCSIYAAAGALITSCKKNDVAQKKPACRIVTINDTYGSGSTVYNVSYNNDGRISTLTTNSSSSVFTYTGNTIIINRTSSGTFTGRDSITTDNNRKLLNIRQFSSADGTSWSNTSFEYSGNGDLLKSQQTNDGSSTPQTTLYTITNGNLVSIQSPTDNITLEYFADKPSQAGDYLEVVSLINYGVSFYPHKSMLKSISNGGTVTNFNYEMNGDDLVSKLTSTSGGSVESILYQYNCN